MKPKPPRALTDREIAVHPLFNKIQQQEYKKRRDRAKRKGLPPYTALDFADTLLPHAGRLMERIGDHPALVFTQRRMAILYVYEALRAAKLPIAPRGLKLLMRQLERGKHPAIEEP